MNKYIGKILDGRYEIKELIGIGGMADVYKAYDTTEEREVAVKILKDEYLTNEDFKRRFRNESKAIAVLSHPNIVKIYDVSFGDKIQFIVMEYVNGITLKEYIEQRGGKVTGSVTSKTDYLINNDVTSNSSKNKKARELEIPILSEEDFLHMAEEEQ